MEPRDAGTPQGSVVSPILANLFLHYAFDLWMTRTHPAVLFERYADDAICHCRTEFEAEALRVALAERFAACGLVLHPQKTKVVYCADTNRKGRYSTVQFDFLDTHFDRGLRNGPMERTASRSCCAPEEALKAMRQESGDGVLRTGPTWPLMIWLGW